MRLMGILVAVVVLANVANAQTSQPAITPAQPVPGDPLPAGMTRIFDGKTLAGWAMDRPYATTLGGSDIRDLPSLVGKLKSKVDPVSAFVAEKLDEPTKTSLTTMPADINERWARNAVSRGLNGIINGESIYDPTRFAGIKLRPETQALAAKGTLEGDERARLNRALLEDAFAAELGQSPWTAWVVNEHGALASTGAGRGVLYTTQSFKGPYRIIFDIRHAGARPGQDHEAGVLVFCTAPKDGEKPMDALGGIQFQVPKGGSWDYRRGKNNSGRGLFTRPDPRPSFNNKQWARVEIVVNPTNGTARMAVAQPVGSKAVEVLSFKDETAGQDGPFALQMHNAGLFDEFANLAVQLDVKDDELITTK